MPTTAVATPLLVIATTSSAAAPAAVQEITQILSTRHHITDPLFQDFQVQTLGSRLTVFNQIITLPTDFVPAIAALSLLVGGIGILNIMLVSVTDRTRGSAPARQSAPPTTRS